MSGRLASGANLPEFVDDIYYANVATADFSPLEDPSPTVGDIDSFKGFLVRPQADGNLYGITWRQYEKAGKPTSLSALVPVLVTCTANQWIECVYVKVFAGNDATYPTTASPLNIGVIL